jgi:hypothetical protein
MIHRDTWANGPSKSHEHAAAPLTPARSGRFTKHAMSRQRPPPKRLLPDLEPRARSTASGEYRIVGEPRRRSSTKMGAVRPEIRRTSSTSLPAVRVPPQAAAPAQPGPRRYNTVQMQAIAPLSAGRELDDFDFDFDIDADGALELDSLPFSRDSHAEPPRPSGQLARDAPPARPSGELERYTPPGRPSGQLARVTPPPMARMTPGPMLPPAPAWPMASATGRRSSSQIAAVDPHAALVAFAGFGDPPARVWGTPAYALRVMMRRRDLRRDLTLARRRHSPDVGLYEASLRTADDGAVRNGMIVAAVFFTMMSLLVWTAMRVLGGTLAFHW